MIVIRNKMRFVFLAMLASISIGITNVWAMKDAKKDTASFRDRRSIATATVKITNYCRKIIAALNNDNIEDALKLLNSFYKKIPSTLKNSTRKRTKGQEDDAFEAKLKEDALNYHKSLFLCLAMCLKMSVIVDKPNTSDKLAEDVGHNRDYSEISLCVSTAKSKTYLIKFETTNPDKKDEIDVKISISLESASSPAAASTSFAIAPTRINISGGYKTDNFFKNTTTALVPATKDSVVGGKSTFASPNATESEDRKCGVACAASGAGGDAIGDSNLQNRLALIFNAIPAEYRVYLEQYYHFLIFSMVNFMGSSLCFAEFITGQGRADLIIRTERDGKLMGSIIELKRAHSANEALMQITDREYINSFDEKFQILGISIFGRDEDLVTVECKKKIILPAAANILEEPAGVYSLQITSHTTKLEPKKEKVTAVSQSTKKRKMPTGEKNPKKRPKPESEESESGSESR